MGNTLGYSESEFLIPCFSLPPSRLLAFNSCGFVLHTQGLHASVTAIIDLPNTKFFSGQGSYQVLELSSINKDNSELAFSHILRHSVLPCWILGVCKRIGSSWASRVLWSCFLGFSQGSTSPLWWAWFAHQGAMFGERCLGSRPGGTALWLCKSPFSHVSFSLLIFKMGRIYHSYLVGLLVGGN